MKKNIIGLLVVVLSLACSSVAAQGLRDVKINEVLVKNQASYADDHANHVGWIELFNSGYSQVNVGGAYLRFKQGDKVITYKIPKTDVRTQMAPQGYLVFFADGSSNKGTFHTNFMLDEVDSTALSSLIGLDDTLELLDQSGNTVVDFVVYDVNTQVPDVSYGRIKDSEGEIIMSSLTSVTPMQSNETIEPTPKSELFRQKDKAGVVMALIAMSVVFMALVMLYLIFKNLGKFMVHSAGRGERKAEAAAAAAGAAGSSSGSSASSAGAVRDMEMNGEEIAAIAIALQRYSEDLHDLESEIITINRVARTYSPWSSKIYGVGNRPERTRRSSKI